jgi:Spy/CpxP family protein refolding chaperone
MPPPPPHRPGGPHGPGGPGGAGGPGGEGLLERLLNNPRAVEFLELTDEQIAEMRAARDAMRDAVKPVQDQIREQSEALRELMTGDVPPTEEAARQLAEEIGLLRTAIQVERLATMVKMRNILTPEQVEKLRGLRERMERREGPPAWAGPRGDRGRGERGEGRPEWAGRNEDRGERGREGRGRGEGRPWRDRN